MLGTVEIPVIRSILHVRVTRVSTCRDPIDYSKFVSTR